MNSKPCGVSGGKSSANLKNCCSGRLSKYTEGEEAVEDSGHLGSQRSDCFCWWQGSNCDSEVEWKKRRSLERGGQGN